MRGVTTMASGKMTFVSTGIPVLAFVVLSALAVVIFRGIAQKNTLESHNDAERTMNVLLSSLRDHKDFGEAIDLVESLRDKVIGVAAYGSDGTTLYTWGAVPPDVPRPEPEMPSEGEAVSMYIDKPANDSIALVFRTFRGGPPPPRREPGDRSTRSPVQATDAAPPDAAKAARARIEPEDFFFTTLRKADFVYLEIRQASYWRNRRLGAVLFPLAEAALAALVFFVRGLLMRNAEYARRIEDQRNLVVLGTAASTLAHEIKNPLLSIRLQTRILERTWPGEARREIDIINDEVERLSALSHRVGDYLRDPAGNPSVVDARDIVREVGLRLCGRDILSEPDGRPAMVLIDPERLRSVLENLVRNAIESGGPEAGVAIEARNDESDIHIDVFDRGQGMEPGTADRVFDPFYTTKSRGTGIGLAVCRRFIQVADGSIVLENREGGGCAARIVLPHAASRMESPKALAP
jgi:two-component system sensor histidine kinase HydH